MNEAILNRYRGSMIFGNLTIGFQIEAERYIDQDREKPSPDRIFLDGEKIIARYPLKQIVRMDRVTSELPHETPV